MRKYLILFYKCKTKTVKQLESEDFNFHGMFIRHTFVLPQIS